MRKNNFLKDISKDNYNYKERFYINKMINDGSKLVDSINGRGSLNLKQHAGILKPNLSSVLKKLEECKKEGKPYEKISFVDYHIVNAEVLFNSERNHKDMYILYLELPPK
jgi:hypothetical protein